MVHRPRARHVRRGAVLLAALLVVAACKKSTDDGVLQPQDLVVGSGTTFDPNEIVTSKSFTDSTTLTEGNLAQFLGATPYGNAPSFLSTYQSDGYERGRRHGRRRRGVRDQPARLPGGRPRRSRG